MKQLLTELKQRADEARLENKPNTIDLQKEPIQVEDVKQASSPSYSAIGKRSEKPLNELFAEGAAIEADEQLLGDGKGQDKNSANQTTGIPLSELIPDDSEIFDQDIIKGDSQTTSKHIHKPNSGSGSSAWERGKELAWQAGKVAQVNLQHYGKIGGKLAKEYANKGWGFTKQVSQIGFKYSKKYGALGWDKVKAFANYSYRQASKASKGAMNYMKKEQSDEEKVQPTESTARSTEGKMESQTTTVHDESGPRESNPEDQQFVNISNSEEDRVEL